MAEWVKHEGGTMYRKVAASSRSRGRRFGSEHGAARHNRSKPALAGLAALLLSGCTSLGPTTLAGGRGLYNEVINATEDEQTLNMIVRDRYAETFGMLAVTNVTASVRAEAHLSADAAIGNRENFAGNLVPLQAGIAYEDNPTISYEPIGGETFMRRMLRPVSIDQLVLIVRASFEVDLALRTLVKSINGLRNTAADGVGGSPKFERFLELFHILDNAGVWDVVGSDDEDPDYYINLQGYAEGYLDEARELLGILGVTAYKIDGRQILMPLRLSIGRASDDTIDLETRSVLEVIRVIGRDMEIPTPHRNAGLVKTASGTSSPAREASIVVRSSRQKPADATVSVYFRDWWFYIDADDVRSKQGFVVLQMLISMQMDDSGGGDRSPVLTIPVGG